jgi:hypothetical protein
MNYASIITFFTQSSEDPTKTSATLTGILIGAAAWAHQYLLFIPGVSTFFQSPAAQSLDAILTATGMVIGGVWTLVGLFRKLTNTVEQKSGLRVE